MQTLMIKLLCHWRALLIFALIPTLTNCSRIDGAAELHDSEGEPYSLQGAKVEAFDLNPAVVLPGGTKIPKGLGSVETADGAIALQVVTATIDDDTLYDVEIRCPANNTTDACNVEYPLHIVLTGAQLKAGGWTATVLTEIAFQNIAYYAATAYSAAEITQILDNNANALLLALPAGTQKAYDDLLAWSAAETDALKRAGLINTISESLAAGIAASDLKVLAQRAVSAELSGLDLSSYSVNSGVFEDVKLIEGYAYLTGESLAVTIVDIRDPNAIALAGLITEEFGFPFTAAGDFFYSAYTADWPDEGEFLYVTDLSNRQQPQTRGQVELTDIPTRLVAAGGYVYAASAAVLTVIDVTDPATPTLRGSLAIAVSTLVAAEGRVYIGNANGIHIVDVSTPSTPLVVGSLATAGTASAITLIGDYAYVTVPGATDSDAVQLHVINISDATAPVLATQLTLAPGTSRLTVLGTRVYADSPDTVQILDISTPSTPVLADSFANVAPSAIRLTESAFLSVRSESVWVFDPGIDAQPVVQSATFPIEDTSTSMITAANGYAYMPNRLEFFDYGFKVFDLADPLAPALVTAFEEGGFVGSIVLDGDYAFLGELAFGEVNVVDISTPATPVVVGSVRLDDGPIQEDLLGTRAVVLSGNRVFVPWGHGAVDDGSGIGRGEYGCTTPNPYGGIGGLLVLDVSTRAAPAITGHVCLPEEGEAVAVSGNHAYVAVADGSLQVVDVTDPAQPVIATSLTLAAPANAIAVVAGYLWVTEGNTGIEIFNISNPAAPVLLTRIAVPGNTSKIDIDGNHVYVAAGSSGVHIFDVGNPALPQLVGSVSTYLPASAAFVEGDYLYASTSEGLEIFKAFPGSL